MLSGDVYKRQGQVVAEIDPTDYKLDYDAKRASFQKASSQMQRAEKLLEMCIRDRSEDSADTDKSAFIYI